MAWVDYSVANQGPLVAYRFDGEQKLTSDKFVARHRDPSHKGGHSPGYDDQSAGQPSSWTKLLLPIDALQVIAAFPPTYYPSLRSHEFDVPGLD